MRPREGASPLNGPGQFDQIRQHMAKRLSTGPRIPTDVSPGET